MLKFLVFLLVILTATSLSLEKFARMWQAEPVASSAKAQNDIDLTQKLAKKSEIESIDIPSSFRLPNNTFPINYDLAIRTEIHRGDFNYNGTVRIRILVMATSNTITLHCGPQLNIRNIKLISSNGSFIQNTFSFIGSGFDFLIVVSEVQLNLNQEIIIEIEFSAVIRNDGVGIYRTMYANENGENVWLASTLLQPNFGRHAFPCYGEIRYRATFHIQIQHHESYHAVSNIPIESIEAIGVGNGFFRTYFETTPPMPVHLVSFAITDFTFISNTEIVGETDFRMRVYARPEIVHQALQALKLGQMMLYTMENLFEIRFPLAKADQILIPGSWSTVEGWGLITLPERIALPANNDSRNLELQIAHEFAVETFRL